ncbi:hypothetical protein [Agrococcus sp. KRD186]|jgi:hypothetical protein|uniref:hypothetical protein n=1 Tax=Agrococcus sp. KRD186 TaxID=2729730 RepID=UPI0019D036FE|nr:hypothetical protein [Agrococcus sp. KRD186]
MRLRTWITIVAIAILVLASGLAIADQLELEWLRLAVLVAAPAAAGIAVLVTKNRKARTDRSMELGSVERAMDVEARAGAFKDSAVAAAAALLLGALVPDLPAWVIGLAVLVAIAVSYWVRRVLVGRASSNVSDE